MPSSSCRTPAFTNSQPTGIPERIEQLPIISVTTWPNQTDEQCRRLIQELTRTVREVTGAPLDKITVYIQEIPQNRWGEAGAIGDDPNYPEASRRTG